MKTLPNPVSRQEFEQLFQKLSNWGRWGQDDDRGTLNYIKARAYPGRGPPRADRA